MSLIGLFELSLNSCACIQIHLCRSDKFAEVAVVTMASGCVCCKVQLRKKERRIFQVFLVSSFSIKTFLNLSLTGFRSALSSNEKCPTSKMVSFFPLVVWSTFLCWFEKKVGGVDLLSLPPLALDQLTLGQFDLFSAFIYQM